MFAITGFRCTCIKVLFCIVYYSITGAMKIVCYTEDFVISRFFKLKFHCINHIPSNGELMNSIIENKVS